MPTVILRCTVYGIVASNLASVYTYLVGNNADLTKGKVMSKHPKKAKAQAFAKMMSTKIGTANKALAKQGVKRIYDNKALNLAIGATLATKAMPKGENARLWCATNGIVVDVRDIVHENKRETVSHLRPENTVRARLEKLAKLDKRIAKVAYCRYLVNGTPSANDASNADAYKVYLYLV